MYSFQKSLTSNTARGSLARYIMALEPTSKQAARLDSDLFQGHAKMRGIVHLLELVDAKNSARYINQTPEKNGLFS